MPTDIVYGEQIGIRVALFNYWDADLEVISKFIKQSINIMSEILNTIAI